MRNAQQLLDEFKRRVAKAILQRHPLSHIREKGLANMERWESNGVWVTAHDEWRTILSTGSDADVIEAMTGTSERANRLRQSAPYAGLLDDVTRAYLFETRGVESDADVEAACRAIDLQRRHQIEHLFQAYALPSLRRDGLAFLERLQSAVPRLSETESEWLTLLQNGSDEELLAVVKSEDARAIRLRLRHPFSDVPIAEDSAGNTTPALPHNPR